MRHVPLEGVVLGHLRAYFTGGLVSLWHAVGGRLLGCCLLVLSRRFITVVCWCCDYYGGYFAVVVLADALPPLLRSFWWILCHPCYSYSSGCFAAMVALLVGRLRWMLCRRGATASDGYLATLML